MATLIFIYVLFRDISYSNKYTTKTRHYKNTTLIIDPVTTEEEYV
jgi:hypothetical protein